MRTEAWVLVASGEPLVRKTIDIGEPGPTEAIVEVEACGLCHTDLGFARGQVAPVHALPLVLGHEITGTVTSSRDASLVGRKVIVPAVMSCGACAFCKAGRGNACTKQVMPGNHIDGGFARHVRVPVAQLVTLDGAPAETRTDALGVVADAVSTAYQATKRANVEAGDVAFVVGAGGVGGFCAQIASAAGAHVIACDIDKSRLAHLASIAPKVETVDISARDPKDVRKQLHARARELGVPSIAWRVFECSGTSSGQLLAFTLLANASTAVFVGFTRDPVNVRLSNLMALDATAIGSWGCPRERYPEVLDLVYRGEVQIEPFVERAPMSRINEHLAALAEHRLERRLVLDPRT